MSIKCVIFDCDGLMFDTERVSKEVWLEVTSQHHISLKDDFFIKITGTGRAEAQVVFDQYPGLNELLPQIYQRRKEEVYRQAKTIGLAKKGLEPLLDYLDEHHIKYGAASSSIKEYLMTLIHSLSKPYNFSCCCAGEDVVNHKPDPEVFLLASKLMNEDPSSCLVLEDSKLGIMAAHNAKMIAGFIEDTIPLDEQTQKLVDVSFKDLSEVIDYIKKK